jgi:hypothetical protein
VKLLVKGLEQERGGRVRRGSALSAIALLGALALTPAASGAEVIISINKTTQRMSVSVVGEERYSWPVSTGMAGYATPAGSFTPSRLKKEHYSKEWDSAPMPHSIFFTDAGHAIHESQAIGRLGTLASHGCIRLAPTKALSQELGRSRQGQAELSFSGHDCCTLPLLRGLAPEQAQRATGDEVAL